MWCDKKDKLKIDCLLLLLTVTRTCVPVLHDAFCGNVAANVRDLSPPQSPLCGRVEAWGEGKRNRAGNIVHHTFCLIIAIFILEYPSAGASAEEMRETTCKGQTNCLSNSNRMPDLNREIFSHNFIAFSHARGHLVSRASRLQLSHIRQLYWLQQGVMTWLVNECLWCTRSLLQFFFSAVKSCQDFYHFDPEK